MALKDDYAVGMMDKMKDYVLMRGVPYFFPSFSLTFLCEITYYNL